ncbi:hypothetical protein [Streptomyces tendae]
MEVIAVFVLGALVGITAALITRRPAERTWERFETWLAKKIQALIAKKTN